jgi:hypothetical protein
MLSRVKPILALVQKTMHDLEAAEQKMKSLESKRLVSIFKLVHLPSLYIDLGCSERLAIQRLVADLHEAV